MARRRVGGAGWTGWRGGRRNGSVRPRRFGAWHRRMRKGPPSPVPSVDGLEHDGDRAVKAGDDVASRHIGDALRKNIHEWIVRP